MLRDIWEVVHEKEKQEWAYYGALRKTTARRNGPRVFSTDVLSLDPSTTRQHQKDRRTLILPYVINVVKGLAKIKVDDINCVTLVHHARHRLLEDQQIGDTGNHANKVR